MHTFAHADQIIFTCNAFMLFTFLLWAKIVQNRHYETTLLSNVLTLQVLPSTMFQNLQEIATKFLQISIKILYSLFTHQLFTRTCQNLFVLSCIVIVGLGTQFVHLGEFVLDAHYNRPLRNILKVGSRNSAQL